VCLLLGPLLSQTTFAWGNHTLHFMLLAPAVGMLAITGGETAILKAMRSLGSLASVQVLAVVDANRVGYAALRANTSTKSFILDHCTTGRVVRVLSTGKNWTKIDYDGMRGYVLTSSLEFYPNAIRSYETGLIAYEGRTTGKSTINIRANAKNNSRILGDYVLGTPLTIFERDDKWCEVDVAGWHCYILTEYVSLTDTGSATASK